MPQVLLFFRPRHDLRLAPEEVARDLLWGEEVEGLIDLPIKEVLDRLKAEFPDHRETPGLLVIRSGAGQAQCTWTWQHLKAELHDLPDDDRRRLIGVLARFETQVFEGPA